jgi:site-specific recombinase XerD
MPLLTAAEEMLRGYMKRNSKSEIVFPGEGVGGHAQKWNFSKTLRHVCLRAGVTPFCPHGPRNFYTTEMLKKGAILEVVGWIPAST